MDPSLPRDDYASLTCPQCRGHLARPRVRPGNLPDEPPATSRRAAPVVTQPPVPSHALVGLSIAALFLLLLVAFFIFLLLTPHSTHVNPYYPKP